MSTLVARQQPSSTAASSNSNSGGSTPSLFFIALGIGVVFINLWLIIGIKYCCRHRRRRLDANYNDVHYNEELQNIAFYTGRVPRRAKEKKLISLEELNQMFPVQKYKEWRSNREENGLPTEGGISSAAAQKLATTNTPLPEDKGMTTTTIEVSQKIDSNSSPIDTSNDNKKVQTTETTKDVPDISGDLCAICIDNLEPNDEVRALACHHVFHSDCVTPWLTTRRALCPLCKMDFYKRVQTLNEADVEQITSPHPVVLANRNTPQLMYPWEVFVRAPRLDRSQQQQPQENRLDVSVNSTRRNPFSNLLFWRRSHYTNSGSVPSTANNDTNV